jgi:hypothetical protein
MSLIVSKWFKTIILVFCFVGVASLASSVITESLNVDGVDKGKTVQGVITKVEGNKITIKDQKGNLTTVGVRGQSTDDKQKLRLFRVGDKVKIEGGKLMRISPVPKKI